MKEKRNCGKCTLCCKILPIKRINKPKGEYCTNCDINNRCAIYQKRPQECKDFRCEWLKGFGAETDRPDKTGIILDFQTGGLIQKIFVLWETTQEVLSSSFAKQIIKFSLENEIHVCLVFYDNKKELIIPKNFILSKKKERQIKKEKIKISRSPN